ncbi:amino acid permease [candidate division KSB1 bacterium]|nr:amino acid permease [candidate division KSB1 bacterium]
MDSGKLPRNQSVTIDRKIGPFTATSLVIANIIGSGIFTTSGLMTGYLPGAGWVIVCWLVGGVISMAGALCYAELATRMPEEGGEYLYLKKNFHPVLGFLTGWTSFWVGFSVPIAASAIGFVEYFAAGINVNSIDLSPFTIIKLKKVTGVVLIVLFTMIHYSGLKPGTIVQNSLTMLKILIVIGLAIAGFSLGAGNFKNINFPPMNISHFWGIGTAMMFVNFSYSGWNASAYIAGEVKNPRKTLPISLVGGTFIVIILYLAINLFIFHTVPYEGLKGKIPVVELASVQVFGPWMGKGLSFMISLALLSSLSAFILLGPRVYFAMAKDKLFFPFAASVHPRFHVPGRSILIQGGIAILMVLLGSFEQLLIYLGFALGIFPWLAVAGLFWMRKNKTGEKTAVKTWGYPITPIFFLLGNLFILIVAFYNRPFESSAAIVTVLSGIPLYFLWIKKFSKAGAV